MPLSPKSPRQPTSGPPARASDHGRDCSHPADGSENRLHTDVRNDHPPYGRSYEYLHRSTSQRPRPRALAASRRGAARPGRGADRCVGRERDFRWERSLGRRVRRASRRGDTRGAGLGCSVGSGEPPVSHSGDRSNAPYRAHRRATPCNRTPIARRHRRAESGVQSSRCTLPGLNAGMHTDT